MVTLAVQYQPGCQTDERSEERLCRFLAPHLRRMIDLERRLGEAESQRSGGHRSARSSGDRRDPAVSDRGWVMAANRGASEMAAAGDGFSFSREGPAASEPADSDRLSRADRGSRGDLPRKGSRAGRSHASRAALGKATLRDPGDADFATSALRRRQPRRRTDLRHRSRADAAVLRSASEAALRFDAGRDGVGRAGL